MLKTKERNKVINLLKQGVKETEIKNSYSIPEDEFNDILDQLNYMDKKRLDITHLPIQEIDLLIIKMTRQQITLLSISKRKEILQEIIKGRTQNYIQERFEVTDYEIHDIIEQANTIKNEEQEDELKSFILKDSRRRTELLYIKLDKTLEEIAKIMKTDVNSIIQHLQEAEKTNLIEKQLSLKLMPALGTDTCDREKY